MKILFITSSLEPKDGWGRYGNGVIETIAQDNEVRVACFDLYEGSRLKQYKILHSPHSIVSPFKIFFSCMRLQKLIDSFQPDVVHFIVEPYVFMLPFLNIQETAKKIITAHGTYSFIPFLFVREKIKLWLSGMLTKKSYKKLNKIIAVSSFTKQHILNQYADFYNEEFDRNKVTVVSNGIDLRKFSLSGSKEAREGRNIVFVGAVKKRKGILESLNAIAKYRDKHGDNFSYKIVGPYNENDEYVQQVRLKIKELGLEKKVTLAGKVSDKELLAVYAIADLFLMLPIKDGQAIEGFGLVYLEANIYGIPTIGSVNSGAEDAISDGVSGYLVDPFNSAEVAEKIHSIIDNNAIKSENCIEWARKHDVREKAKELIKVYLS